MIVDKNQSETPVAESTGDDKIYYEKPLTVDEDEVTLEEVQLNPISEMYYAFRRVLLSIPENENDPNSKPLFNMVKLDTGQFDRIVFDKCNSQDAIAFPAAFIRFTEVRYLVSQQRLGEGRATVRIRFVLNDLANEDYDHECHGFDVFQKINQAIQDAKGREVALSERCTLQYFDMPETMSRGLQAYWIDYGVYFDDISAWKYRNWIERYLVFPPFTNHSDAPQFDFEGHGNHYEVSYDEATKFANITEDEEEEEESLF